MPCGACREFLYQFLSEKFDITKHKNYKLLEDCDKSNVCDVEKYMIRKDNQN